MINGESIDLKLYFFNYIFKMLASPFLSRRPVNMNNAIEQQDRENRTNTCTLVCLVINIFAWVINVSVTLSVNYDNFYKYSLQNYTGYDSYFIPPWWVIILNGLMQLYMIGYNIWLVTAQLSLRRDIKTSVRKIASSLLFHNLLRTIEYIIYSINADETKNTNTNNTNHTIIGVLSNESQGFSILMVLFSAIILGIDIGMMTKLRTFYYSDSKLKNCLFDIPVTMLFSWSVVDFIIQLNNILNVSNWGYNENIEAYYGFIIWMFVVFFIILLSFRNMIAYLFYIILLIGYGAKFYEYDQPMYDRNDNLDAYEGSIITCVSILISFVAMFGYGIHYSNMYSKYRRKKNAIVVSTIVTGNAHSQLNSFINEPEIGGPLDEIG